MYVVLRTSSAYHCNINKQPVLEMVWLTKHQSDWTCVNTLSHVLTPLTDKVYICVTRSLTYGAGTMYSRYACTYGTARFKL